MATDARKRLDEFLSPRPASSARTSRRRPSTRRSSAPPGAAHQVRSVEDLLVYVDGLTHDVGRPIEVPAGRDGLSGRHLIVVRPDQDDGSTR